MRIYTRRGDDGTTGLLHGGRVRKDDPAPEAYGAVDEVVAALGVARAHTSGELAGELLDIQRQLFVVAAELATAPANRAKLQPAVSLVTADMVAELERRIDAVVERVGTPGEFVVPGQSQLPAALDLARSVARRAERRAVTLAAGGGLEGSEVVSFLNRLADYLYMLAREAESEWEPARRPEGS